MVCGGGSGGNMDLAWTHTPPEHHSSSNTPCPLGLSTHQLPPATHNTTRAPHHRPSAKCAPGQCSVCRTGNGGLPSVVNPPPHSCCGTSLYPRAPVDFLGFKCNCGLLLYCPSNGRRVLIAAHCDVLCRYHTRSRPVFKCPK